MGTPTLEDRYNRPDEPESLLCEPPSAFSHFFAATKLVVDAMSRAYSRHPFVVYLLVGKFFYWKYTSSIHPCTLWW